jgi:tetratricopeptide (TPR) repeat protein
MFAFARKTWFAAILAFLWGLAFVLLFRYALNTLYPFWAVQISLSLFAYLLISIAWFSFWWYFHRYKKPEKKSFWFFLAAFLNSASFLAILYYFSESRYLYGMPFFFSLQIFFQFYIFSSKLPFFLAQRMYLMAGLILGFLPIPYALDPFIIFPLTIVLSFFPAKTLQVHVPDLNLGHTKLLPLRQALDFLRFLFLAFALYGILDMWRSRFYPILGILVAAVVLQALIHRLHHKKEHIKYGIFLLPAIFLGLAVLWLYLPFAYWCAAGYTVLAVWESIYFRKTVEGYLNREQLLAGIALLISICGYFITYEWCILITGLLTIGALLRITAYISTSYRKIITVMYFSVILAWSFIAYEKFKQSFTRDFFAAAKSARVQSDFFPVEILSQFGGFSQVKTNVIPDGAVKSMSEITEKPELVYSHIPAVFLTLFLEIENQFKNAESVRIVNMKFAGAYSGSYGYTKLTKYLRMRNFSHVYLYPGEVPHESWIPPRLFQPEPAEKIPQIYHPVSGRMITLQAETSAANAIAASWFKKLAYYYKTRGDYQHSLNYFERLLKFGNTEPGLLRDMASVAGSLGKSSRQIELLQKYISQSGAKENMLAEKKLLMELLFLERKISESAALARSLVKEDAERTISYYRWLYKIFLEPINTYELRKVYSDLKSWQPALDDQIKKKELLLSSIADTLAANPEFYQRFQQESRRQEFIIFPE